MRYYILMEPGGLTPGIRPFILAEAQGDLFDDQSHYPLDEWTGRSPDMRLLSWSELNASSAGRRALTEWANGDNSAAEAYTEAWKRQVRETREKEEAEWAERKRWAPQLARTQKSEGRS
jgi:hypothetical protein